MKRGFLQITSLLLFFLLSGCTAHITRKIDYTASKKGALSSFSPKSVYVHVTDDRPVKERDSISNFNDGLVTASFRSTVPPPEIIYNALKSELEFNNHRVVDNANSGADISLEITLTRFYGEILAGNTIIKVANVDGLILAHGAKDLNRSTPWPLNGIFKKTTVGVTGDCSEELTLAVVDFVHNLTFDSRFIEVFQ